MRVAEKAETTQPASLPSYFPGEIRGSTLDLTPPSSEKSTPKRQVAEWEERKGGRRDQAQEHQIVLSFLLDPRPVHIALQIYYPVALLTCRRRKRLRDTYHLDLDD